MESAPRTRSRLPNGYQPFQVHMLIIDSTQKLKQAAASPGVLSPILANCALFIAVCIAFLASNDTSWEKEWVRYLHWPLGALEPTFLSPLGNWDASHYLHLAVNGYSPNDKSNAFYPLWPAIMYLSGHFFKGPSPLVGLCLSTIFWALGIRTFSVLLSLVVSAKCARDCLWLYVTAPCGFFFHLPYSEALFFYLLTEYFLAIEIGSSSRLVLFGALLPLSRPVGVFILLSALWTAFVIPKGKMYSRLAIAISPLVGFLSYLAIMKCLTGNAFAGFDAQQSYANKPAVGHIFDLTAFIDAFLDFQFDFSAVHSLLDRVLFLFCIMTLPLLWKLRPAWFFWVASAGVIPALTNWCLSYRRFAILLIPAYAVWANLLIVNESRRYLVCYSILCAALQAILLYRFLNFQWAG